MLKILFFPIIKCWQLLSFIRKSLANLLILMLVIIVGTAIFDTQQHPHANKSALIISPAGALVDEFTYQPTAFDLLNESQLDTETRIRDLTHAINQAATDNNITGIILYLDALQSAGISKMEEVGQALTTFKESNKPVIAYADNYSQQQYFLASYADEIYLNTFGAIPLTGFGLYRHYIKDATDKLAINFHVFRVGTFKDAVEPFIRNNMSQASREQNTMWLNQLWQRYTDRIEKSRQLLPHSLDNFIAQMPTKLQAIDGNAAQLALDNKLVDGLASRVEFREHMIKRFGENKKHDGVNAISVDDYVPTQIPSLTSDYAIGLIVASGNIVDGSPGAGAIGADSLSELIRQAKKDKNLKALIIRIDSGGGSAFASEVIREEISRARSEQLPIYISMGSVTASGGYWIATAGDEIWATPSTLTGSIGVFGLVPNVAKTIEKLGIHSDGFGTSPLADAFHPDRPMSAGAQKMVQSHVENIYRQFLQLVANARQSTPESINQIAQGRVWSGSTALDLGLVDKLGSLDDLIAHIREKQDIANADVKVIERDISFEEQLIKSLLEQTSSFGKQVAIKLFASSVGHENATQLVNSAASISPLARILTNHNDTTQLPQIMAQCESCYAF